MKKLKPEKLSVEYRQVVTPTQPVIPRRYTLTHSDITGELFLTIGSQYAFDKIGPTRDEVLAEWKLINNEYILYVYVYVNGQFGMINACIRNKFFIKELPLALEAIFYGDRAFLKVHPELYNSPIWIYFDSVYPQFNRIEYWGVPFDYK
ncbi:staygreen family protein [Clostridium ganghwense]|uniref:Staygreen family protein n=1 Tax=Clostridium ganghwense TaxID=312089 RepID=A0ABT4CX13_9CLOT|nr:staygreen family protein [Clostridium ganghwense]MCY6372571.1 staygreen family protein [Clostridium ganghwense]